MKNYRHVVRLHHSGSSSLRIAIQSFRFKIRLSIIREKYYESFNFKITRTFTLLVLKFLIWLNKNK